MGGGGYSESKSKPPQTVYANPIAGVLANLFGIETSIDDGGITYGGGGKGAEPAQFAEQVFGPGSGFEEIGGFFDLLNPYGDITTNLGQQAAEGALDLTQVMSDVSTPALAAMTETGMPTDVDALVQQSMADVAEQYSGVSGVNSSDFTSAAMREAAQLRVGADEAAKGRQLSALGFTPSFASSFGNIMGTGADLLALGEDINLSSTPTGRATALTQIFAGLQPTGAVSRGNVSKSEAKNASVL